MGAGRSQQHRELGRSAHFDIAVVSVVAEVEELVWSSWVWEGKEVRRAVFVCVLNVDKMGEWVSVRGWVEDVLFIGLPL